MSGKLARGRLARQRWGNKEIEEDEKVAFACCIDVTLFFPLIQSRETQIILLNNIYSFIFITMDTDIMVKDILAYNDSQSDEEKAICELLMNEINLNLPETESKIWHRHPVWFLNGNPIVGYSKRKSGICLLFWSGQSFEEKMLKPEGSFKAAEILYTKVDQINTKDLKRWLNKSRMIQWDYKNIVKRKGVLERLLG